ncbi:ABC transporter substrate-binding protein [Agromyces larvae]|uniref:ABC transporter substrate-binding protein n=1 Tax=Agromyces larvae TaxID=2929802 RepID=A0ABY4BZC8_9MICO|nr:ABC transporter substrate-binding protein [Agromyces larvae]UOE43046.1 ABC transporter substrate-binding protein [Agromyces larvae]
MMFLRHLATRRRRALLAGAAFAAAATLGLAGCTGSAAGSSSAADTLIAYTGQSGDYQINFNPYAPTNIGGRGSIYEGLFFINKAGGGEPEPLLGTEYSWNDDGTVLSITLRDDVTWTDGEAFDADDVVFTLDMLRENESLNTTGFDGVAEKVDDTHVTVTWDQPAFISGPDILGGVWIVPEHIWKDIDPATNVMEQPVGTGPFTLTNFKPQAFTLTANPDYWGGEPKVKNVRYISLSGNTAGADALAAGTIDWQTGPVPNIDDVAGHYPGYDSVTIHQSQMVLGACANVDLGCTGPQTDPAVRQALYYAMDRTQLNSLAFTNTAADMSPTFALLDSQSDTISDAITEPVAPSTADAAKAGEILEAAGWAKGDDGIYAKDGQKLSLTIETVSGWTDYITALETITQQAKDAGIEVNAAQSSWNEWTDKKSKGDYQLAIDSLWQGPASDPYYVYHYFFESTATAAVGEAAGNNFARYSVPEVDAALEALSTIDPADADARQPYFDVIQQHIVEDMPYIPILTGGTTSEYHADKFTGWPTEDDLYAVPAVWSSPDNAEVFKRLAPAGE